MTSQAGQDVFVLSLLGFPLKGFFVDIGCNFPIELSNSYEMERMGWNGICVDRQCLNDFPLVRKCHFIHTDATTADYSEIFEKCGAPEVIDYLSLDIDEWSFEALSRVPFDDYTFKVITIEHDTYRLTDWLRVQQRRLLWGCGYSLICSNVCADVERRKPFEDWWVKKEFFSDTVLYALRSERKSYLQILETLKDTIGD